MADEIDDVYNRKISAIVNDEPIRAGEAFDSGPVVDGSSMECGGSL